MLSFYSMPACKPWGRPENMKGTMGEAPEVQGPATLHSLRTGRTTEAFCLWVEIRLNHSQSAKIPCNRGVHRFYMLSFPDARKTHNRLRWIGKTQKMVGTSKNSFMALTAYMILLRKSDLNWFVDDYFLSLPLSFDHSPLKFCCVSARVDWDAG